MEGTCPVGRNSALIAGYRRVDRRGRPKTKSSPPDRQPVVLTPFRYVPELAVLFYADRRVISGWRIIGSWETSPREGRVRTMTLQTCDLRSDGENPVAYSLPNVPDHPDHRLSPG